MSKKKIFWGITLIISMLACILAVCYIVLYFFSGNDTNKYIIEETSYISTEIMPVCENHNLNWKKIQKDNSDIYSWIYIPGTKVDYGVVQASGKNGEGDDFYLNHNLQKKYEFAGSIYSEMQNAKDYSDPVTVLYGHNMLNGTMFASLHQFEDKKFFKKHKYIYVYTPQHRLTYEIYAAYVYDDRHILNSFDFSDNKILKNYFKYTLNPESVNKNTRKADLDTGSRILTLSTCTNGAKNTRYLVQGVLIKDERTN